MEKKDETIPGQMSILDLIEEDPHSFEDIYECSCGYGWDQSKVVRHHFCPNCGRAVDNLIKTELNRVKTELEPCEDAVSRQAVLEILNDAYFLKLDDGAALQESVKQLPSVTPQPKMGRWIPVSERLPEDEQEILFSTKTGRVHCGRYHDDNSANKWYSYKDKCRAWNNVVDAWMPLPEPYMEEWANGKEQE